MNEENKNGISKNPNGRNKLHSDINMFKKITKKSNNSDLINIVRSVNFMVKSDPVKDLSDDEMCQGFDLRIRMVHLDSFYRNNHRSIIYQFQKVPMKSAKGIVEGKKVKNKMKNKSEDIIPFDYNRVKLTGRDNDYINASYIKSPQPYSYRFIATQGVQKDEDVEDFWRMVVQKEVVLIILLTPIVQLNKVECVQYWPGSGVKEYGSVRVELKGEMQWPTFVIKHLLVSNKESGVSLLVSHMVYLAWPENGVPCNVASLLNFHHKGRQLIQQKVRLKKHENSEQQAVNVVVQCRDGGGRTGTMIGIDCLIEEARLSGFIKPFSLLMDLRSQRNKMIRLQNEYLFCHKALSVYGKIGNTTIYTTKNDDLKTFLSGNPEELNTALKQQIELIEESGQTIQDEKRNSTSKKSETYPAFGKPQAFRLGSIEDETNSLFLDQLLECCFVLVLRQQTMRRFSRFLPEQHQSINLKNFKVTRMKGVGGLRMELKIERIDSAKEYFSDVFRKSLKIECANATNDVTQCYKRFSEQLMDPQEQPILILYSIKERQDCLWSLVKLNLLEMADKHAEVDVYQSVYNIYNWPCTTHNFSLDVASYKHMHHFALGLLQKEHRAYEDDQRYDDVTNAKIAHQREQLHNNLVYLKHDNKPIKKEDKLISKLIYKPSKVKKKKEDSALNKTDATNRPSLSEPDIRLPRRPSLNSFIVL